MKYLAILISGLIMTYAQTVMAQTVAEDQYSDTQWYTVDDEYKTPTIENLSRMYWAIGQLQLDNPKHIDNFIQINDCEVYKDFYNNDIEWERIRTMMGDYIESNRAVFPVRFEVIRTMGLGRYDLDTGYFDVEEESFKDGIRRIEFVQNSNYKKTCVDANEIEGYPKNIVLILNQPLVLPKISVPRDLAEQFIKMSQEMYGDMATDLRVRNYDRQVFPRLKVRILRHKETIRLTGGGGLRSVVFAQLEGVEIYADQELNILLYKQDFRRYKDRNNADDD